MYKTIEACRICGNSNLQTIIHLGIQSLTGVFPRSEINHIPGGPLELVRCTPAKGTESCGLVQLRHSFIPEQLYGDNYGYRSGLNGSMVNHLAGIVDRVISFGTPEPDDLIVDIASNDGTLLKFYPESCTCLVGIDPTAKKFESFYESRVKVIPDFFSKKLVNKAFPGKKARIVTSIAMFYDLESPMDFVTEVADLLSDDGIWALEQSYMPAMLENTAYDTICHEHLEYYGLKQVRWLLEKAGLKIIYLEKNETNGGSFMVIASKVGAVYPEATDTIREFAESENFYSSEIPYQEFAQKVEKHKKELRETLIQLREKYTSVMGYGASTKGNVMLQYCGIDRSILPCIADVNPDKDGAFTPGTLIPIIAETEARNNLPGCFVVLPWHFRDFIINKEQQFLDSGGKLLFPLPNIELVEK